MLKRVLRHFLILMLILSISGFSIVIKVKAQVENVPSPTDQAAQNKGSVTDTTTTDTTDSTAVEDQNKQAISGDDCGCPPVNKSSAGKSVAIVLGFLAGGLLGGAATIAATKVAESISWLTDPLCHVICLGLKSVVGVIYSIGDALKNTEY